MLSFTKFFSYSLLIALLVACGSGSTLTIKSNPDKAEIYVQKMKDDVAKKIGETPLTIPAKELNDQFGGSGPIIFELRKTGYHPRNTLVTELKALDLEINMELKPVDQLNMSSEIDTIINDLFECQKMVRTNRVKEAQDKIRKLKEKYPYLSTIYEVEGGIMLLQGDKNQAIDLFDRALKLNPNNIEAMRMIKALEKTKGERK